MPTLMDQIPGKLINKRGAGRPRGSKNVATESIRWGFVEAYRQLGGVDGLVKWGRKEPNLFYPLLKSLLPHELAESGLAGNLTIIVQRSPSDKPLDTQMIDVVPSVSDTQPVDVVDGRAPKHGV